MRKIILIRLLCLSFNFPYYLHGQKTKHPHRLGLANAMCPRLKEKGKESEKVKNETEEEE